MEKMNVSNTVSNTTPNISKNLTIARLMTRRDMLDAVWYQHTYYIAEHRLTAILPTLDAIEKEIETLDALITDLAESLILEGGN